MGHLNCKSLNLPKKMDSNGVSFYRTVALQHGRQPCPWRFSGDLYRPDGIRYAFKISDEHARSSDIYLLMNKEGTLPASQSFVQSMVILSEVCVERLTADKKGNLTGNDIKDNFTQTGVLLERASTNTPQLIGPQLTGMSERVRGTIVAMVRCTLADIEPPTFFWGNECPRQHMWGPGGHNSRPTCNSPTKPEGDRANCIDYLRHWGESLCISRVTQTECTQGS